MKNTKKLALVTPVLSVLIYSLRRALYAVAVDEKGLLVFRHPLSIALWAAVACGGVLILAAVWKLDGPADYDRNFKASPLAALGHLLLALVIGRMAVLNDFQGTVQIVRILRLLGTVLVPMLLWGGICRFRGKKPFFLIHSSLTVFLLLYLVSWYQIWSGNPQLQDYVFELLAAAAMLLFGYHCTAFETDMGNRRAQLAMGLLAVLLCGGALAKSVHPDLYGAGLIWAAFDLCALTPPEKEEVTGDDPA